MGHKILGYDFEIIYKKEKKNVVADALARKDEDVGALICAISIIQPEWITEEGMNGRMMKRRGHSFKSCNKIQVHMKHLAGKIIHYGTKITYIFIRIPNSNKIFFWKCTALP